MRENRKAYEAGETIRSFTGQAGIVLSRDALAVAKDQLKEGRRPGHYFAPGCCHNPDYLIQVPVLFEDGTYDVMRSVNIKKTPNLSEEEKGHLLNLLEEQHLHNP
jgi:hypothetical protein